MAEPLPSSSVATLSRSLGKREAPLNLITKDFGISEATLHNGRKRVDIEEGFAPV